MIFTGSSSKVLYFVVFRLFAKKTVDLKKVHQGIQLYLRQSVIQLSGESTTYFTYIGCTCYYEKREHLDHFALLISNSLVFI